ncbi:hypothetical protein Tco_0748929 [Tanacetum coccineum]|uniref:Uncharacterized protein n=1 Tax=Tanacetum coccineum TaxID=301880 RepID=A0ABQ4Z0F5_9ASTR
MSEWVYAKTSALDFKRFRSFSLKFSGSCFPMMIVCSGYFSLTITLSSAFMQLRIPCISGGEASLIFFSPSLTLLDSHIENTSADQGPFELGTIRNTLGTTPEGGVLLGPERPRTYEDLSDTEKKRYDVDVRVTNIVLQGLPKDIYKLINHNIEAKAIWDNVKTLFAGSELTKEDRESQLYDEFERFKMLPGENINEYYVRFHKLVNDMRNIRMTMPNIQLNSKFVNNMSPE